MPTLTYQGGPQDGAEHKVPGKPPSVRHWASPGERAAKGWCDLHRYVFRQCIRPGAYVYEYTGVTAVDGPRPAKGVYGGEVIEGWE